MTNKEFIIWLKGFVEACNDFTPTPAQWDSIKEELDKISETKVEVLNTNTTTATSLPRGSSIYYTNNKQQFDKIF
jgi:hypothetical protein